MSETGTGGACADGTALDGATGVTVSPDGSTVYVASETSRAVSVFSRDSATGAITQLPGADGCVSDSGTGGACADGTALVAPRSVAVSPDGTNLYFPASTSAAVAVFARDLTTGRLAQLPGTAACVSETGSGGACADGVALEGARSAAVSPDGKSVYVASYVSDAGAVFARESSAGALAQAPDAAACVSETGTGGACVHGVALDGARAVTVSPDGTSVYVAAETSAAVAVFSRDGVTGDITQLVGTNGCVSQTGTGGACTDVRALGGAGGVAVSPDGLSVYVAAMGSDAVAVFSRDPTTGALTQLAGTAGCVSETGNSGSCTDGRGLDRARSVAVSLDGKNVYAAAETGDSLAVFSRDQTTGRLTQLPGTAGCVSETGSGGECADGTALDGVRAVDVSPDGKSVYAASFYSSAVSIFSRDETTGALTQLGEVPAGNTAPVVAAGVDQTITFPASAFLDGTVTDDGRPDPPAALTVAWSQVGGPGTVAFQDMSTVDTNASFSTSGTYVLRLTASDSVLSSSDELSVTVVDASQNMPPEIVSDGGGATASVLVSENQSSVTDVDATDANGDALTFTIAGGADMTAFTIVPSTGVLTFLVAPDFEAPTDAGANNVYDLIVSASDGSLSDTQTLAVTVTDVVESAGPPLYFSLTDLASVGGVTADNEDVVFFDGQGFALAFDGSDVGLGASRIDAFSWVSASLLLLSLDAPGTVSGIAFDDSDLLRFEASSLGSDTAGTFSLFFDGSDVGLTTNAEDVDAVELLPNGHLLLSTFGLSSVPGLAGEDEDLLEFAPTSLGANTAGTYSLYFDGSDVGLTQSGEDVDAAAVDGTGTIYLSTVNNFVVTGISGADEDVFVFTPSSLGDVTAGTYSPTLYLEGSTFGLAANDVLTIDLP